jgi:CorA-like Mg2+ transporter protein
VPQAEVIRRLGRDHIALIAPDDRVYFRDVYDHIYRMAEVAEAYRQLLESAYEMYRSVREDDLNRRLTVLTMISALLLPITTIAGIYGMNFDHMPELRRPWAYPLVLASFVAIIVGGLLLFRSWGWIGGPTAAQAEQRRQRRAGLDVLELPLIGQVLRLPAYGARFALAGSRRALGIGRFLVRGRANQVDDDDAPFVDA